MSTLERRAFISAGVTLSMGVLSAPLVLHAVPSLVPPAQGTLRGDWAGDWSIDDMWNHLPRPAARIGLGRRRRHQDVELALIDRQLRG